MKSVEHDATILSMCGSSGTLMDEEYPTFAKLPCRHLGTYTTALAKPFERGVHWLAPPQRPSPDRFSYHGHHISNGLYVFDDGYDLERHSNGAPSLPV